MSSSSRLLVAEQAKAIIKQLMPDDQSAVYAWLEDQIEQSDARVERSHWLDFLRILIGVAVFGGMVGLCTPILVGRDQVAAAMADCPVVAECPEAPLCPIPPPPEPCQEGPPPKWAHSPLYGGGEVFVARPEGLLCVRANDAILCVDDEKSPVTFPLTDTPEP